MPYLRWTGKANRLQSPSKIKRKNRGFTSIQMLLTHTHVILELNSLLPACVMSASQIASWHPALSWSSISRLCCFWYWRKKLDGWITYALMLKVVWFFQWLSEFSRVLIVVFVIVIPIWVWDAFSTRIVSQSMHASREMLKAFRVPIGSSSSFLYWTFLGTWNHLKSFGHVEILWNIVMRSRLLMSS